MQSGQVVRTTNSRISSKLHQIFTVESRKLSLSAFDDKRFILRNGIKSLPYGHYTIRDLPFLRIMDQDQNWGDVETDEEEALRTLEIDIIRDPDWGEAVEQEAGWLTPDPGFHQPHSTDSEYDDEIANLSEVTDSPSPLPCPFLDLEAREDRDDETLQIISTPESTMEQHQPTSRTRTIITITDSETEGEKSPQKPKRSRKIFINDSDSD